MTTREQPGDGPAPDTVRVNRAPVLTLWAAVVAERLGHSPDIALTLGRYVAGSSARAKARRLGLEEDSSPERKAEPGTTAAERKAKGKEDVVEDAEGAGPKPRHATVRLLGRDIPVVEGKGVPRVQDGEKPISAASVRSYVARAFGDQLPAVRKAMERLAAGLDKDELNRVGFRLYEGFRPEVPEGVTGWGAKGALRLDRIRGAAP